MKNNIFYLILIYQRLYIAENKWNLSKNVDLSIKITLLSIKIALYLSVLRIFFILGNIIPEF